ncbi:MAG: TIGR01777 family oxidoreductase [Bdellovibrionales bacterium]|nr:TIGR01777 family oxidoreductase [Bdellovibrionales bacterium]
MSKKVLISGGSGLVGKALVKELRKLNYQILNLVRRTPVSADEFFWNPAESEIDKQAIETADAIVHLAGENIADGPWSKEKKKKILESRVKGTESIANAIKNSTKPPKVWISASAIGIYGAVTHGILDENSASGEGFLADVCRKWEAATNLNESSSTRVVNLRIGIVLSKKGGALKKMLLPFQLGLGGQVGNGQQYMSWISLKDLISSIIFCLENEKISGAVNAVAPLAVTNRQFTKALGETLGRPTIFPLPAFLLKLVFGEMANETILSSINCKPKVLLENDFPFEHKEISQSLRWALE